MMARPAVVHSLLRAALFLWPIFCYLTAMRIEYLFATSVTVADCAARKKGWRPAGRAAWLKADGTTVCFICFEEQLAAVPAGVKVHRAA